MIEEADLPAGASAESQSSSDEPEFGSLVAENVYRLLRPAVTTLNVELLDVEWTGRSLRLTIDAEGGVTSERLVEVNRLVSPLLDQHDPVPGRYLLEVSSPGVERPLRRPDHFRRAVGEQVIVKQEPGADPRRIRGELLTVDDESIAVLAVEIDGVDLAEAETHHLPLDRIAKARTHFDWGPTPKKGGKGRSGTAGKGGGNRSSGKSTGSKGGSSKSAKTGPKSKSKQKPRTGKQPSKNKRETP